MDVPAEMRDHDGNLDTKTVLRKPSKCQSACPLAS